MAHFATQCRLYRCPGYTLAVTHVRIYTRTSYTHTEGRIGQTTDKQHIMTIAVLCIEIETAFFGS